MMEDSATELCTLHRRRMAQNCGVRSADISPTVGTRSSGTTGFGTNSKGTLFFCFSLTRALCMRPAGKNKRKKHTEHEMVQFLGTTEHERGPYTHATRQKTHNEHERVQF